MNNLKLKIRLLLWLILVLSVIALLYLKIVPSGQISYTYDFSGESRFITRLTPQDRLGEITQGVQTALGNPVYFNLNAPRGFDEADVTVTYKNTSNLEIIEAGVLVDSLLWRYKIEPLENAIINDLLNEWEPLSGQSLILLQKPDAFRQYNSIDEFLANLPATEKIATYNYDLKIDYKIPAYQAQDGVQVDTALRGDWQLLTYIKDENLRFSFDFYDLNQNKDKDDIAIFVYYQGGIIESKTLADNSDSEDGKTGPVKSIDLDLASLPEGVYKLELKAGRDIVTKKIITDQSKLVFLNSLELWSADDAIKLITDSRQLQFTTTDPASFQEIKAIGLDSADNSTTKSMLLNKTYKQFALSGFSGKNMVDLPKGGLRVSGDGVFAISEASFFNPRLKKVDENINISQDKIEYIIADYQPAAVSGDWQSATAHFDLRGAYQENNKYSFMISVPGLRADDKIADSLEISEIKIDLRGKSIIEKLKSLMQKI